MYVAKPRTIGSSKIETENPQHKEIIRREQWRPDIYVSPNGEMYWDRMSAVRPDGRRVILQPHLAGQLLLLSKRGVFGNLSAVILDPYRHSTLRSGYDNKRPGITAWTPANVPKEKSGATA